MNNTKRLAGKETAYYSTVAWTLASALVAALLLKFASFGMTPERVSAFYRLVIFDDRFVLWLSLPLIVIAFLLAPHVRMTWVERLLTQIDRSIIGIAVASFAVFGVGAVWFYHRHPLSMDEFSIVYQSQVFAAGRLDGQVPPHLLDRILAPYFIIEFFGIDRARGLMTSAYWPGTSILMTPFALVGAPWLLNPFISALTVFCLHRATRALTGSVAVASWTTLFLLASPVFIINAGSFYAMPAHMLANILYFWSLVHTNKLQEVGGSHKGLVFVAGLIGGFALVLHNPIPHLAFSAPWLIWVVSKRRDWILPLLIGYLVFALPLGVGWFLHLKTLNAAIPGMEGSILARLPRIFVLPSIEILAIRMFAVVKILAWSVPGLLVLVYLAWRQKRGQHELRLLTASVATLFFAYFFISYPQGLGWGYRFIHPAWFVFPILAAVALNQGIAGDKESGDATSSVLKRQFFAAAVGLALCVLIPVRVWQVQGYIQRHLAQIPTPPTDRKSILFVNPDTGYYMIDLVQNDPFLRGQSWKMIAQDPASDLAVSRQILRSPIVAQKGAWGELIVEK